jgi:hypothetical protein
MQPLTKKGNRWPPVMLDFSLIHVSVISERSALALRLSEFVWCRRGGWNVAFSRTTTSNDPTDTVNRCLETTGLIEQDS